MSKVKISVDNLLNISAKLNKLDLNVEEKGLLCAVFQAAGTEIHGDVSAFGLTGNVGVGGVFGALFGVGNNSSNVNVSLPGVGDATFVIGDGSSSGASPRAREMRRTL